jgi:hypothetical protein
LACGILSLPFISSEPDDLDTLAVQYVSGTTVAANSLERVELGASSLDDLLSGYYLAALCGLLEEFSYAFVCAPVIHSRSPFVR